eukprot:comp23654_c0_seq1/m.40409 comp23654_c0_seq1/g.40409  ORF comp23654_c0_seq1/g.40409 comp23654_c0_seq1/m.40409 type:complete len:589 (+) comp23654_c0_seq1:220-1986(+)
MHLLERGLETAAVSSTKRLGRLHARHAHASHAHATHPRGHAHAGGHSHAGGHAAHARRHSTHRCHAEARGSEHELVGLEHQGLGLVLVLRLLLLLDQVVLLQVVHPCEVLPGNLDEVGHGIVHDVVAPSDLHHHVRAQQVVADVQAGRKACMVAQADKEVEQRLGCLGILALCCILHGILVEAVLLAQADGLGPPAVLLIHVGGNPSELNQLVLLKLLGQGNGVKVVEGVDGVAQAGKVVLVHKQLVEVLVDGLDVLLLHQLHVWADEGQVAQLLEHHHRAHVVDLVDHRRQKLVQQQGGNVEVELQGLVDNLRVGALAQRVLELRMLPGISGVLHHRQGCIVELVVVHVEEHQFLPQVRILGSTHNLGDVDTGPEELEVLHHLLGLVAGVEDCQLRKHAHVRTLQTKTGLQKGDDLIEVAPADVVVDQLLQLVGMDHNVQTGNLSQPELLGIHAGIAHLLPCAGAVCLAGAVDGGLELAQLDEGLGQPGKVADVVEQQPRCLVHARIEAAVANLLDLGQAVGAGDELLQVGQAVALGIGVDQLGLDVGLTGLGPGHVEVAHKVLELVGLVGCHNHVDVISGVLGLDV